MYEKPRVNVKVEPRSTRNDKCISQVTVNFIVNVFQVKKKNLLVAVLEPVYKGEGYPSN